MAIKISNAPTRFFFPAAAPFKNIFFRGASSSPGKADVTSDESTIRHQLGDDWSRLHPNIQKRFKKDPHLGERIVYEGVMNIIRRSAMGCLFAHLTRIIGNPLTPYAGTDVPMEVTLYKKPGRKGVYWQRTYHYPESRPYTVTSVKQESEKGEMMECVGGGFGMLLNVYAQDGSLHFESYRYFCALFGIRLPLPHWLTPGKTHVIHEDLGGGDFRFTISMDHRQLGRTFYQEGVFRAQQKQQWPRHA